MPRNTMSLVLEDPRIPADVLMPRDEDVERMVQVIEADALLVTGQIVCAAAGHCALGSLLFATGMTNNELARSGNTPSSFTAHAARKLYDFYRLDQDIADAIMSINDDTAGAEGGEHAPEDLDPELSFMVMRLREPTPEAMQKRKEAVIAMIRDAVAIQRQKEAPSLWWQLHGLAPLNQRRDHGVHLDLFGVRSGAYDDDDLAF